MILVTHRPLGDVIGYDVELEAQQATLESFVTDRASHLSIKCSLENESYI